jgi:hypothetical protein
MDAGPGQDASAALAERAVAARDSALAACAQLTDLQRQLAETRQQVLSGRSARKILHDSVAARLVAQLETMPVIEQAKGVLVAQHGCTPDEAFTLLRAASQRANVPVRDLAARIVARASAPGAG